MAHTLKHIQQQSSFSPDFSFSRMYDLMKFLKSKKLDLALVKRMLIHVYNHPEKDFDAILFEIDFTKITRTDIIRQISFFQNKYKEIRLSKDDSAGHRWIMGKLNKQATGNISLSELSGMIYFAG
jgi:Asp-tRNA(Asn)/Glu-tRNA(Gln) amidotransferase B subunit